MLFLTTYLISGLGAIDHNFGFLESLEATDLVLAEVEATASDSCNGVEQGKSKMEAIQAMPTSSQEASHGFSQGDQYWSL